MMRGPSVDRAAFERLTGDAQGLCIRCLMDGREVPAMYRAQYESMSTENPRLHVLAGEHLCADCHARLTGRSGEERP